MPFQLNILGPRDRHPHPPPRISSPGVDDYDSEDSTDSNVTRKSYRNVSHHRPPFVASSSSLRTPSFLGSSDYLLHPHADHGRLSLSSTATSTPIPSRSASPLPQFFPSVPSSTYASDADSEPTSPLLARNRKSRWWNDDGRRWWIASHDVRKRKRRRAGCFNFRSLKRIVRMILRHPLFPTQPTAILLTLLVLTIFAILLTLLLMHVLNPDKEPLPWRAYCSIPSVSTSPPSLGATSYSPSFPFNALTPSDVSSLSPLIPPPFPPPHLDDFPPVGLFLGVFTMDSAVERRMLIRSTWANHERSRNGAGSGDDGLGTSRTVVRFVLGKPRSSWEKRIQLEAETYNDMIVLPIAENMNSGKTHAFFTWAATEAWVPSPPANSSTRVPPPVFSYSNVTADRPIALAKHDPYSARQEWHLTGQQTPWVRPDFVVKVDDDSFVMLAELEARLRVELHSRSRHAQDEIIPQPGHPHARDSVDEIDSTTSTPVVNNTASLSRRAHPVPGRPSSSRSGARAPSPLDDPLIYWGYLVKNQFMAGELYALSWSIVDWVSRDPAVRSMTRGKEDKQVAKWMGIHPRALEIRWKSERCWIYDHPRAGTVYSHGFLFPSEVTRIRRSILSYLTAPLDLLQDSLTSTAQSPSATPTSPSAAAPLPDGSSPSSWAYSSVSKFGVRYSPPVPDLDTLQSVEALVEGSEMSSIREGGPVSPEVAWSRREGRATRYEGKRVGGTVVVHFIKKNPWFLETALAFLEGSEVTEREAEDSLSSRTISMVKRALSTWHARR